MKKTLGEPAFTSVWSADALLEKSPTASAMTVADAIEFADAWKIHICKGM